MLFDGFIVRGDCIVSLDAVRNHLNVKRVILLPRDWVLYEFHHELFQDPDFLVEPVWFKKMQRFPELRQARIEMVNQQRELLAPWYAKKKKLGDADAGLPGEICLYRICTLGPMRWLPFQLVPGWDSATKFTVTLDTGGPAPSPVLSQLIDEWIGASESQMILLNGVRSEAGSLSIKAKCPGGAGPCLASLWVLLSDARWQTGTRKMTLAIDTT